MVFTLQYKCSGTLWFNHNKWLTLGYSILESRFEISKHIDWYVLYLNNVYIELNKVSANLWKVFFKYKKRFLAKSVFKFCWLRFKSRESLLEKRRRKLKLRKKVVFRSKMKADFDVAHTNLFHSVFNMLFSQLELKLKLK